jgi:hypothetical protein
MQNLLEKSPSGKHFTLPPSSIEKINPKYKTYNYYVQIFTTTISKHTIYVKKIYTSDIDTNETDDLSFFIPENLINVRKSSDYFFRSLLCFKNKEDAEHELEIIKHHFQNHKIIIKGSFNER